MPELATLPTPCLLLDEPRMAANIARIHGRLAGTGVAYRAHLKTAKSVEVARRQMTGPHGPAMVSTLKEAGIFAAAGVTDLTYGVGIAPDKLDRVRALRATGVDLAVILDSVAQAEAVAAASTPELPLAALIEIDSDGHRSGVKPADAALLGAIAAALTPRAELRGVLTHAGESYVAKGQAALEAAAEGERLAVVGAAGDPARGRARLPGGQRRLDPDPDERPPLRRTDRVPRRRLRVLRPLPGRRRGLRAGRDRALGADRGDRPPGGQGLDDHRRRLDGDVARPRHGGAGGGPGLRPGLRPRRPRRSRT